MVISRVERDVRRGRETWAVGIRFRLHLCSSSNLLSCSYRESFQRLRRYTAVPTRHLQCETACFASERQAVPSSSEVRGLQKQAREQGRILFHQQGVASNHHASSLPTTHNNERAVNGFDPRKGIFPGAAPGVVKSMQGRIFLNFVSRIP